MISFARHGQTAVNAGGRLQGRLDEPLSALGAAQARALADVFASERVTRVISSPLVRARETAAVIAARHSLTVEIDERLVELDYGAWDGASLGDVAPEDWAEWQFKVMRPGAFEVEVWQGCGQGQGGSEVAVEVARLLTNPIGRSAW